MTARRLLSLAGLLFIAAPAALSAAPAPDEHRSPVLAKRLERAWPDSEFERQRLLAAGSRPPRSREEVSGTAIFTMAIARGIRHGWLERDTYLPIVRKGWDALKTRIQPDGTVRDICYGTMCSEDVNYYLELPFYDNDTHGLFAVLFAGMEVSRLQDR
jgi:hypothetical protein